ncbi:recombinase family protein [Alkalihalobacillus sp. R86527]|uniref:recombinase family protein n=1 Tax=Alkalihalobacillus sp. R86527 TaxID=3093863 RepID=UPI0036704402
MLNPIKIVAIYLRKSRGDLEKDLTKHKQTLTEIALNNRWKYRIYNEIGSADDIENRPRMQELLIDVSKKLYDGVLVMDIDRLGRGDKSDQAKIESTFKVANTLLITPNKVFDLHNESDAMLSDVQGMLARFEYKQIKKRLNQGKKAGAKFGNWTNGPPPFPYYYDRESKSLKVDEAKRPVYKELIQLVLQGESLHSIAVKFNKKGNRTNRNNKWTDVALHRLLTNEVHLGNVIYGKTSGSGHLNKKTSPTQIKPKNEWIIAKDSHEPVLTIEDYSEIQLMLFKRKLIPKRARKAIYPLTGLIKCSKCGASMNFTKKESKKGLQVYLKKCQKPDWIGNRCGNPGIKQDEILFNLKNKLNDYYTNLLIYSQNTQNNECKDLTQVQNNIKLNREKYQRALERTRELYELGEYSRDIYIERASKWQEKINKLDGEESKIRLILKKSNEFSLPEKVNILNEVINSKVMDGGTMKASGEDFALFNSLLRKVIRSISYTRTDLSIDISVEFY